MKNFKQFVDEVYENWNAKNGLEGFKNTTAHGKAAEKYIANHLEDLGYKVYLSKQSRTPADIYAVKFRGYFWHIYLVQVKSRTNKLSSTYSQTDGVRYDQLARFTLNSFLTSEITKQYSKKPVVLSFANVHCTVSTKNVFLSKVFGEGFRTKELIPVSYYCSNIKLAKMQLAYQLIFKTERPEFDAGSMWIKSKIKIRKP